MTADSDAMQLAPMPLEAGTIAERSGEPISTCYQCLKCTSGCPMAEEMDLGPSKVMRYLQLGALDKVLVSDTIWLCVSCYACSTRCPNRINVAHVMDTLRQEAMRRRVPVPKENLRRFHELFLNSVRRHGRVFETELAMIYALGEGELIQNVELGISMFLKGKMPVLPSNIAGHPGVRELFRRSTSKKDR